MSPQPAPKTSKPVPEPPRTVGARWALPLVLVVLATWSILGTVGNRASTTIRYSDFFDLAAAGKVSDVTFSDEGASGTLKQEEIVEGHKLKAFQCVLPPQQDAALLPLLRDQKVHVEAKSEHTGFLSQALLGLLPMVLIFAGWFWLSRRASRGLGPGGGLSLGLPSRPHRFERQDGVNVRFDAVAGLESAKRDLREVVDFLREPKRFQRLGGKLPRGVLLVGPPGTGKTLLARAVAGEADVPFFYVNGSEFIQMFVGVGAQRVRELFDEAKKAAPSIVFIDEIDAVGRSRGTGVGGVNDEREQTLNQLLSELDGFSRNDLTVVLAATNRPDVLDSALLRPGRFDRRVLVDRPEAKAREAILRVHTKDKPLAADVSLSDLAAATPGFAGAELANLCNEAALNATRRGADAVTAADFAAAMDKIVLGDPRETLLDENERRRVALHEAGHAVLAHFSPEAEPLRRVSILPRGFSLGATQQTEAADRHLVTQPQLEAKLQVLMGGYAAELLHTGHVSSGAENDLRVATDLAFKMVGHYGMSDRVGPVFHEQRVEHPFLGQRIASEAGLSDRTSFLIEDEARRVLSEALEQAKLALKRHADAHERLVAALLAHETLEGVELDHVLASPSGPRAASGAVAIAS